MKMIAMIIMVAIVLEALVEYVKTVITMVEEQEYKTAITQAVTIALGIFLAFAFHLELFNGALSEFYTGLTINSNLDKVLTGILFSRGSNYFSDLIGRLTKKDNEFEESDDEYDDEDWDEDQTQLAEDALAEIDDEEDE